MDLRVTSPSWTIFSGMSSSVKIVQPELRRRQTPSHHALLLTTNLRALDVFAYEQIEGIQFDHLGQPIRRGVHLARAAAAVLERSQLNLDSISQATLSLSGKIQAIIHMRADTPDEEMLCLLVDIAQDRARLSKLMVGLSSTTNLTELMNWRDELARAQTTGIA